MVPTAGFFFSSHIANTTNLSFNWLIQGSGSDPLAVSLVLERTHGYLPRQRKILAFITKILSGGQTGADRAALDAAIFCGFAYGGAIPAGRKTEAGPLSDDYRMEELASDRYPDRTQKNVQAADGTLILSHGELSGGSALTGRIAESEGKPCLHIDFHETPLPQAEARVIPWLRKHRIRILNVAGPRASSDPKIYDQAYALIVSLLQVNHGC
ncbi:MAG: putative molybdenum carrier protein [Desulfofustis sp.]|nr:putative molybdenum carrier protein [Desulfofustis sp.]